MKPYLAAGIALLLFCMDGWADLDFARIHQDHCRDNLLRDYASLDPHINAIAACARLSILPPRQGSQDFSDLSETILLDAYTQQLRNRTVDDLETNLSQRVLSLQNKYGINLCQRVRTTLSANPPSRCPTAEARLSTEDCPNDVYRPDTKLPPRLRQERIQQQRQRSRQAKENLLKAIYEIGRLNRILRETQARDHNLSRLGPFLPIITQRVEYLIRQYPEAMSSLQIYDDMLTPFRMRFGHGDAFNLTDLQLGGLNNNQQWFDAVHFDNMPSLDICIPGGDRDGRPPSCDRAHEGAGLLDQRISQMDERQLDWFLESAFGSWQDLMGKSFERACNMGACNLLHVDARRNQQVLDQHFANPAAQQAIRNSLCRCPSPEASQDLSDMLDGVETAVAAFNAGAGVPCVASMAPCIATGVGCIIGTIPACGTYITSGLVLGGAAGISGINSWLNSQAYFSQASLGFTLNGDATAVARNMAGMRVSRNSGILSLTTAVAAGVPGLVSRTIVGGGARLAGVTGASLERVIQTTTAAQWIQRGRNAFSEASPIYEEFVQSFMRAERCAATPEERDDLRLQLSLIVSSNAGIGARNAIERRYSQQSRYLRDRYRDCRL